MEYLISEISNRDLQLLSHYRVLKQPSDFLKATYRDSKSIILSFDSGIQTAERDDYGRFIYRFTAPVDIIENRVPMLEFEGVESDYAYIQDMIRISFSANQATLYTTSEQLSSTLRIKLFWCSSLQEINSVQTEFRNTLNQLKKDIDVLTNRLESFNLGADYLERPEGAVNHLVKYGLDSENRIVLSDSGYHIITGGTSQRQLINPMQSDLNGLIRTLGGPMTLIVSDGIRRVLDGFKGSPITIRGRGSIFLNNVKSKILLIDFIGEVYAHQCSCIQILGNSVVKSCNLIGALVEELGGEVDNLTLTHHSVFNQKSGILKTLKHVGVGCVYYSEIKQQYLKKQEPKDLSNQVVEGLVCLGDGRILMHGSEISFVTGHHDDPLPPTEIIRLADIDPGDAPQGPDVSIACPEPKSNEFYNTEVWRTLTLSAKFMGADAPPTSIKDLDKPEYKGTLIATFWSAHEFGFGSAAMLIAKIVRAYAMYPYLTKGVSNGFTMTVLSDLAKADGSGVTGGESFDMANLTVAKVKTWYSQRGGSITDTQLLTFSQYVYNNVRYGRLYGTNGIFKSWKDSRLIDAMAYMPTNNYYGFTDVGWSWTMTVKDSSFYLDELSGLTSDSAATYGFVAASLTSVHTAKLSSYVQ